MSRENLAVRTALLGKNLEVKKRIFEKKKNRHSNTQSLNHCNSMKIGTTHIRLFPSSLTETMVMVCLQSEIWSRVNRRASSEPLHLHVSNLC